MPPRCRSPHSPRTKPSTCSDRPGTHPAGHRVADAVGGHALALRGVAAGCTALADPRTGVRGPRGCRPRDRGVRPVRRGAGRGGAGRAGARRGSRRWGLRRFGAVGTGPARAGKPRGPSRCSRRVVLADLLGLAARGTLEARVAGRVPLREAAPAYDKVAGGGQRGRWLLVP